MRALIALNKDEATVSFIDSQSGETAAKVEVDTNPHEVAVTEDGTTSYVTNSGGNTVSVIDNQQFAEVKRISHPDFLFPHGIGLSADESELFIAATRSDRILVIDTQDLQVTEVIATHQRATHMIYMDPDKNNIYVPNIGSDNITVMDAKTRKIITHIPVGSGPEGAAVHPDGRYLYVACQHDDELHVLDLADDYARKAKIRLGSCPIRLVFSPDGEYAFVPNRESGDLSIIAAGAMAEIKRIRTGVWPGGTVFNNEGSRAYVANNKTNDISVIDVESLQEVNRFAAGIHPDGMAFTRIPLKE